MNNVDLGRYSKRIVKYIWDPEPTADEDQAAPIWCLGREYSVQPTPPPQHTEPPTSSEGSDASRSPRSIATSSATNEDVDNEPNHVESEPVSTGDADVDTSFEEVKQSDGIADTVTADRIEWPEAFLDDFESRIWLTYRSGFPPIPKSKDPKASSAMSLSVRLKSQLTSQNGFTSDTGWGCMIRSGQCLLANALLLLRLGRDWRLSTKGASEKDILQLFADDPRAPFSIHSFVEHGAAACGTFPGQWFGPSATAKCIEALAGRHTPTALKVYVTGNGPDVFEDTLFSISNPADSPFLPTLLLIGTRLGIDRVTPAYRDSLKAALQLPQAVGIAGGRPSASHYFVGQQGNSFFYLDPHQTRPALPMREKAENYTIDDVNSCHTRRLRRIPIDEMDPSMLIAFLIRDEGDWRAWREAIGKIPGKAFVHVADREQSPFGVGGERDGAVDEVQTLDDEDDSNGDEGSLVEVARE